MKTDFKIKITKVNNLGAREIKDTKSEDKWKSKKHKEALFDIPPEREEDPLNLYGKWKTIELPSTLVSNHFSLEAECDELHNGDIVMTNDNDIKFIKKGDKIYSVEMLNGDSPFKKGDEIACFFIGSMMIH